MSKWSASDFDDTKKKNTSLNSTTKWTADDFNERKPIPVKDNINIPNFRRLEPASVEPLSTADFRRLNPEPVIPGQIPKPLNMSASEQEAYYKNIAKIEKVPVIGSLVKGAINLQNKYFNSPVGQFTERTSGAIKEGLTGGQVYNKPSTRNKIADTTADIGGNIFSYFAPIGGGSGAERGVISATDSILAKASKTPLAQKAFNTAENKLGWTATNIGAKAIRGAVEGLSGTAQEATAKPMTKEELKKSAVTNALGGAGLSLLGDGIGQIIRNVRAGKTLTAAEEKTISEAAKKNPAISDAINAAKTPKLRNNINTQPILPKQPTMAKRSIAEDIGLSRTSKAEILTTPIKTSEFRTNTIERSTMIPDDAKGKLNPKEFDFIQESSKDWQNTAIKNVSANREKVINNIKQANSISGGVQAHEAAIITSELLDDVRKTGNVSTLKTWLKTVAEKTRETARALKGTDTAWDKKSAEGALTDAQRVIDKIENDLEKTNPNLIKKINGETQRKVKEFTDLGKTVDPDEIRDIVKRDYKVPTLTDEDVKFIVDNMDQSKALVDGSYEQRMLLARVAKRIADKIPSSFGEKLQAAQRISMLLNPKTTIVRNPLGNALLGGLESVKNVFGTPIDMATSAIRKSERTTTVAPLTKLKASGQGAAKGIKEWALDIKNGVDTSPTGAQVEMPKNKIFSENHSITNARLKAAADFGGKAANKVHGLVGRMLQIGDRPFYEAAYKSRLAELQKLRGPITDAMQEDARVFALERTLQNDSGISALFTGGKQAAFLNNHPGAKAVYQFVTNLISPFAKTPANILDKFIDYSPAGTFKAIGHAASTAGKGTFNQKKFVDTLARSMTGTGLAVVGYLMAQKGIVTGDRDSNKKVGGIETALGKQNYAFKIGDTYYTYDWGLPAAAPMAMGADIYNAVHKTKEGENAVLKGTESAVNLLFNSTLLKGPSGFTGGYSPAVALGQGLLNTTTQATPTAGKQIAQLIDPFQRETYDPNKFKQTLNKTVARIPFASKTLPAKVDVFGNEVKAFQGRNNVWNVMFNPGFSTTYNPNEAQKEMIRLYEDAGATDQLPAVAEKYIAETKQNPRINLTSAEYVQYQKRIGQLTMDKFKEIINTEQYKNAKATKDLTADEVKAKMLGDIVSKSKKQAKREILEKRGYKIK